MEEAGAIRVTFFGDPHGDYRAVPRALRAGVGRHAVFLGDFDPHRPLAEEFAPLRKAGVEVTFIHGNHDTDETRWHDEVFEGGCSGLNISGRSVDVGGLRIAGLGGVFREKVWHPRNGDGAPLHRTRKEFLDTVRRTDRWRGGLPLKHRSSIFPEDLDALVGQEAHVLVSHEAPSAHRYGFSELDDLAEILGARIVVHGHHHRSYEDVLPNGVRVVGVGKAGFATVDFGTDGLPLEVEIHDA